MSTDAAVQHLSRDPAMRDLIAQVGPLTPLTPTTDPFGALMRSVIGQQLSVRAAATIAGRFEAATGPDPARVLALPGEDLRALGLSWAKVRTVQAAAEAALSGRIDFQHLETLTDEQVISALSALPGIGRWTAEMYLMFALARPDVFSFGDLGLVRGLERYFPDEPPQEVVARWSPYRTLAARYFWAAPQRR
ncbi:DNA-3-methyladenine glycosylase 2 family protein [Deinococcus sonorensis]|uniref:DNA-3-methyladenine glycosylase II n=2 Tax=Deinococcus sonorensis TaxID=309891 RepID=A0AAU7UC28_9DEIO